MRKTFNLETTIGRVTFEVNGAQQIYVQTPDERTPEGRKISPVTIRGKDHTGNMHFTLLTDGSWEALIWGPDGNKLVPVDPSNDWAVSRAGSLRTVGGYAEATQAAKRKFYEVVKTALNAFYATGQGDTEIDDERDARAVEYRQGKIDTARAKVEKLKADLAEAEAELATLTT